MQKVAVDWLLCVRCAKWLFIMRLSGRQAVPKAGGRADRKGICERGLEAEKADAADSLGGGGKDGGLGVGGGV